MRAARPGQGCRDRAGSEAGPALSPSPSALVPREGSVMGRHSPPVPSPLLSSALLSPARRSPCAWQPRRPPQPVFQPCASSAVTASGCGGLFAVQLISELERGETSPPGESGLAGGRAGGRGEHSCAAGPRRAPLPPPPARRCRGLALGSWKELVGVCTLSSRRGGSRGWELVRAPGAAGGWRGGCGPWWERCSCSRARPPSASSTIATRSWCRPCSACRASAPTSPASTASAAASRAGTSTCWSSATTRASTSPVSTGEGTAARTGRASLAQPLPRGAVGALGGGCLPLQARLLAVSGCQERGLRQGPRSQPRGALAQPAHMQRAMHRAMHRALHRAMHCACVAAASKARTLDGALSFQLKLMRERRRVHPSTLHALPHSPSQNCCSKSSTHPLPYAAAG